MRIGNSILAFLIAAVFLPIIPVKAQTVDAEPISEGQKFARAALLHGNLGDAEERSKIIEAFRQYCIALNNVFPTNSPTESAWITEELNGGGDRPLRVLGSKEWARVVAARFTRDCAFAVQLFAEDETARPQAIFVLIKAVGQFAPDAERSGRLNGLKPEDWAFPVLRGSAIEALAEVGLIEANRLLQGTDVVENVVR